MTITPHDKSLNKVKYQLMAKDSATIFYTSILFSLKTKWKNTLPTAATDGKHLFINPVWFQALEPKAKVGLVLHEVLHVALDHMTRCENRNHMIYNMAGDYVINWLLIDKGYTLPKSVLYNPRYGGLSTEQVYELLLKKKRAGNLPGDDGNFGIGSDIKAPGTPAENSKVKREVADIVLRATSIAKASGAGIGSIPGEILIALDETINPKLPWNVIFQNYMTSFAKDDYSWQRPNRRFFPEYYLPSAFSEGVGCIAEAVDSSGSVSQEEFSYFIHETVALQEMLKPEEIKVIDFDTKIKSVQTVTRDTDILQELTFHGTGGTRILPVLDWARDNNPEVLIIFTDGYFRMPDEDKFPSCPVVWLIHGNEHFTAPVGEIINYNI